MARICIKTTYDYIIKYHDSVLKKQTNQKRTKIKVKNVKDKAQGELSVWLF